MKTKKVTVDWRVFYITNYGGIYIPSISKVHSQLGIASPSLTERFSQRKLKELYEKAN